MLRLRDVSKSFEGPRRRTVLAGLHFDLDPGDYVAVMGESGIGKSTFLNLVAGLDRPDGGEILFEGENLATLDDDRLTLIRRDRMGFVFQAFHVLPHLTLEQNVGLPLLLRGVAAGEIARRAREGLREVGLDGREESYPRELSGGELQRVAIARALIGAPKLVLADEPTGNLDPENAALVLDLRARGSARRAPPGFSSRTRVPRRAPPTACCCSRATA
jgi:putative ABC transport system ATP-binding protein